MMGGFLFAASVWVLSVVVVAVSLNLVTKIPWTQKVLRRTSETLKPDVMMHKKNGRFTLRKSEKHTSYRKDKR